MIVVDTNIVSELMRPRPSASVAAWVLVQPPKELCTTSITLAEIRYGIERLPGGSRQDTLRAIAEDVFGTFADQVLPFDGPAAVHYASLVDRRDRLGLPIDGFDAQIAAICVSHRAVLATRNLKDFAHTGIDVVDPWQA